MTRYPSVYFLIGALVLWQAQQFPIPGIFLMMMGGPLLPGLLLYGFVISFILEALTGRLPRFFLAFPILAIAAYYAAYFKQAADIAGLREELRRTNPGQVIRFDPAKHALVDDRVSPGTFGLPVTYKLNTSEPEGYSALFVAASSDCETIRKTARVHVQERSDGCLVELPVSPAKVVLRIERDPPLPGNPEAKTRLYVGNSLRATYRAVTVKKLTPIPFYIAGCALDDAASKWACFTEFASRRVKLDGLGEHEDRWTAPTALMLGLPLSAKTSYDASPEISALVSAATGDPALTEKRVMGNMDRVLTGGTSASRDFANTITHYGDALASKAGAIADRFSLLIRAQAEPVAQCIREAMPDADDAARRLALLRPAEVIDEEKWQAVMSDPAADASHKRLAAQMLRFAEERRGQMTAGQRALYGACRQHQPKDTDGWRDLDVLANALAALPDEDFATVAPLVQKVFLLPTENSAFRYLYIRSGVAGRSAAQMYKADLVNNLFDRPRYAALGLCRSGSDEETVGYLEKALISPRMDVWQGANIDRQAIALALIKQGRGDYVQAHLPQMSPTQKAWYDLLLSGNGWNSVGPNNCTVSDPHSMDFPGKAMMPILTFKSWSDNQWHLPDPPGGRN